MIQKRITQRLFQERNMLNFYRTHMKDKIFSCEISLFFIFINELL